MMISEHSRISVADLTYNCTSLEFFSLWNSILKKIELENERIKEQNEKNK